MQVSWCSLLIMRANLELVRHFYLQLWKRAGSQVPKITWPGESRCSWTTRTQCGCETWTRLERHSICWKLVYWRRLATATSIPRAGSSSSQHKHLQILTRQSASRLTFWRCFLLLKVHWEDQFRAEKPIICQAGSLNFLGWELPGHMPHLCFSWEDFAESYL